MSNTSGIHYTEDPLYQSALKYFQQGEWNLGLADLQRLADTHPLETELRALMTEMAVRSHIDHDEKADNRVLRNRRVKKFMVRATTLVTMIAVIAFAIFYFSDWIDARADAATEVYLTAVKLTEINNKLNDASVFISARRFDKARQLLDEVKATNPDNPNLPALYDALDQGVAIEKEYQDALTLKFEGDRAGALEAFKAFQTKYGRYGDVPYQIQQLEYDTELTARLAGAEALLNAKNYGEAITALEEIRGLNSDFEAERIKNDLFSAYISQARFLLETNPDSLDALDEAKVLYGKAQKLNPQDTSVKAAMKEAEEDVEYRIFQKYVQLAESAVAERADSVSDLTLALSYLDQAQSIRPDDPEIFKKRQYAKIYIRAWEDAQKERWDDVINGLGGIYYENPDYALGTARQMLYDAYIARGDSRMSKLEVTRALEDYTQAAQISSLIPSSPMMSFEAQVKIAEAYGTMGDYQGSAVKFRAAFDQSGFTDVLRMNDDELDQSLKDADYYFSRANYRRAQEMYRAIAVELPNKFDVVEVVLDEGDTLYTWLRQNNSTYEQFKSRNPDVDLNNWESGQRILIPVAPGP